MGYHVQTNGLQYSQGNETGNHLKPRDQYAQIAKRGMLRPDQEEITWK